MTEANAFFEDFILKRQGWFPEKKIISLMQSYAIICNPLKKSGFKLQKFLLKFPSASIPGASKTVIDVRVNSSWRKNPTCGHPTSWLNNGEIPIIMVNNGSIMVIYPEVHQIPPNPLVSSVPCATKSITWGFLKMEVPLMDRRENPSTHGRFGGTPMSHRPATPGVRS